MLKAPVGQHCVEALFAYIRLSLWWIVIKLELAQIKSQSVLPACSWVTGHRYFTTLNMFPLPAAFTLRLWMKAASG